MAGRQSAEETLKGFAYLTTFKALREWSEKDVDTLQKANTPLLSGGQAPADSKTPRVKVMLIHDYKGGYLDYEACQGAIVDDEMYTCDYLRYVEDFIYFSHRLVTIPPPTWINTCHRNGVRALGTLIVEPGSPDVDEILRVLDGRYWVADRLTAIAKAHGFDGWLINIETAFTPSSWRPSHLEGFLTQLKRDAGQSGKIVWYDALTVLNLVWYQNSLNNFNLRFAQAAGSILTNYAWEPQFLEEAKHLLKDTDFDIENVYFGIDVWAQNIQTGRNRRITWPRVRGGGTATSEGVAVISQAKGPNVGIFAPGWSFEHFSDSCRAVERTIWEGRHFPDDLPCACLPERPHDTEEYGQPGITKYASERIAGTSTFVHLHFKNVWEVRGTRIDAHLGRQPIMPGITRQTWLRRRQNSEIVDNLRKGTARLKPVGLARVRQRLEAPGSDIEVYLRQRSGLSSHLLARLDLAPIRISTKISDLIMKIRYSTAHATPFRLTVNLTPEEPSGTASHFDVEPSHGQVREQQFTLHSNQKFAQLSVLVTYDDEEDIPPSKYHVGTIFSLTIQPAEQPAYPALELLYVEERIVRGLKHQRLVWNDFEGLSIEDDWRESSPWSALTGPYAYFNILCDEQCLGCAYTSEFVLPHDFWVGRSSANISISGIGFDGSAISQIRKTLYDPTYITQNWHIIEHIELDQS